MNESLYVLHEALSLYLGLFVNSLIDLDRILINFGPQFISNFDFLVSLSDIIL